ncbi:MAG: ribose-phosphate pyrophosphokinase [Clostridia bacterium]|nr:ribose-phosphate pyrophosphokinase [Clostridia bacterium]MBR3974605.1 ribose-phosphate pyrophosphokinase [Clostridia bacterium]
MPIYTDDFSTVPYGTLGILALPGCEELGRKIDSYLVKWRDKRESEHKSTIAFAGYERDSYLLNATFPRFGTGEAKCMLKESVRGYDVFILCDCFNYGITHEIYGRTVPYSPDEHYANLKRAIAAMAGKARRITVIMPMLYEGRQHKRGARESLDCALALQELCEFMGVDNIITFDAHDPRVMNAIPLKGFENVYTTYQMIKAMVLNIPELKIDKENLMIISPDEGGVNRGVYYSSILGLDLGMFYKRRDYSRVVKGRNPIIAHEFLGSNVENKDVIVIDDMISSGESMLDVAKRLKSMNARNIYVCSAFGLFCNGLEDFDKAYEEGYISKVFTTNLIYRMPELKTREWYCEVDLSKYISLLIDALNHDMSISTLLNHAQRIKPFLEEHGFNIVINSDN